MFSGLIREIGYVNSFQNEILDIKSNMHPKIGDSIAVNGVCLTAISSSKDNFCVELSSKTSKKVAIENFKGFVHLEPALSVAECLHGHIVQGHIDFLGEIVSIVKIKNEVQFIIKSPACELLLENGSVCIDGVSLTLGEVKEDIFTLTIISHTFNNTIFKNYKVKRRVNIETDIFVRNIFQLMQKSNINKKLSWQKVDEIMARF